MIWKGKAPALKLRLFGLEKRSKAGKRELKEEKLAELAEAKRRNLTEKNRFNGGTGAFYGRKRRPDGNRCLYSTQSLTTPKTFHIAFYANSLSHLETHK